MPAPSTGPPMAVTVAPSRDGATLPSIDTAPGGQSGQEISVNPQAEMGTTDYQRTAPDFYREALDLINLEEYRSGADPAFRDGILARLAQLDTAAPSDVANMGDAIVWDIRLWIEPRMLTRMGM